MAALIFRNNADDYFLIKNVAFKVLLDACIDRARSAAPHHEAFFADCRSSMSLSLHEIQDRSRRAEAMNFVADQCAIIIGSDLESLEPFWKDAMLNCMEAILSIWASPMLRK